jgi:hypothetical protein
MAKRSGLTCEIRNAKTGKRIAWTWGVTGAVRWEWISRIIAAEYECDPDEVGCVDTEERFDNITVRGEIVAYEVCDLLEVGS